MYAFVVLYHFSFIKRATSLQKLVSGMINFFLKEQLPAKI